MKFSRYLFVVVFVTVLFAVQSAQAAQVTEQERQAAFAWFDTLGNPDVTHLPFVRIAIGRDDRMTDSYSDEKFRYGFLLEDTGTTFTVFLTDFSTWTFSRSVPTVPVAERVGYERIDLKQWVPDWLKWNRAPHDTGMFGGLNPPFDCLRATDLQAFLVARACSAIGYSKLAADLCDFAAYGRFVENKDPPPSQPAFQQVLSDELATHNIWTAVLDCGNPAVGRETLLTSFGRFVRNFPTSRYAPQAREAMEMLNTMVEEDRMHARLALKPLAQMPAQDRVRELIFQLREQNGHQNTQPGTCDVFADLKQERSPASQLVTMGLAAIPQLIDHLNDRRLTRSIGFWRNFTFSHHVLRVGDVVEKIIERIAHRTFYSRDYSNGAMVKDGTVVTVKAEIQSWWAQILLLGEKHVLIASVERGDADASYMAERLVEKYPEAALQPIAMGLHKAREGWIRCNMIIALGRLKGQGGTVVLKEQLEQGADLETRHAAAVLLWQRGDKDAVHRMILDWQRLPADDQDKTETDGLIHFLAGCGKVRAINALAANLSRRRVARRASTVLVLNESPYWSWGQNAKLPPLADNKARLDQAEQRLLVRELLDTAEYEGFSMGSGNMSFSSPRVCELAGFVLAQKWPNHYKFSNSGTRFDLDQQRIRLYNVWCAANGQRLHSLP